jgi:hypothetical protein
MGICLLGRTFSAVGWMESPEKSFDSVVPVRRVVCSRATGGRDAATESRKEKFIDHDARAARIAIDRRFATGHARRVGCLRRNIARLDALSTGTAASRASDLWRGEVELSPGKRRGKVGYQRGQGNVVAKRPRDPECNSSASIVYL